MDRSRAVSLVAVTLGLGLSACGSSSSSQGGGSQSQATPAGNKSSSFCVRVGTAVNDIGQAFSKTAPANDPNGKKQLSSIANAIDGLDNQAPGEIASAIHTLRVTFDQMSDRAQKGATSDQVGSEFQKPDVKAANDKVSQYVADKCGIDNGAGSSPTPKDQSTPPPPDTPSDTPTP